MLLAVLTCQSATEAAQRHFPTWRKHFENIVFVTTVDSHCWVPEGVEAWAHGRDFYPDRDNPDDNLIRRTIEVLEHFLTTYHDRLVLIEYDVVLFARPALNREFSGTMFAEFIHSPWCFDQEAARRFVRIGRTLLQHKAITGGWPDRHMRLMFDLLRPTVDENNNYSRNTLDQPHMIAEAREAVKNGCWAVHGLKTKEQFEALMAP